MKKSIEDIRAMFTQESVIASAEQTELVKLNEINRISEKYVLEMLYFMEKHPFDNAEEEIDFFKNFIPQLLSPPIEENFKYNVTTNKPISTNEKLASYYEEALQTTQSFFVMNNFHYQYFRNNFKELDRIYFLRDSEAPTIPILEIPSPIKGVCPAMSYLFAKFDAYENVQRFLIEQIDGLRKSSTIVSGQNVADQPIQIKWTGDLINVIELAYGLWLTGQLNNGNASLNQIVRWLEQNLSISIGIAQRKFSEISRRKRISVTKFLDQMKDAIMKKIDSGFH